MSKLSSKIDGLKQGITLDYYAVRRVAPRKLPVIRPHAALEFFLRKRVPKVYFLEILKIENGTNISPPDLPFLFFWGGGEIFGEFSKKYLICWGFVCQLTAFSVSAVACA